MFLVSSLKSNYNDYLTFFPFSDSNSVNKYSLLYKIVKLYVNTYRRMLTYTR